jgi:hypothetical protein
MRQFRTSRSVRGAPSNRRPDRDPTEQLFLLTTARGRVYLGSSAARQRIRAGRAGSECGRNVKLAVNAGYEPGMFRSRV